MNLALFPLSTVLFPGMSLPIHVLDERHLLMIRRCLERKTPFGAVLIKKGSEVGGSAMPCDVGTTAAVTQVQKLPGGRMNIIVRGRKRFRIIDILGRRPYLVGEVELLTSYGGEEAASHRLADSVAALFGEYYRLYLAISGQWARRIGLPGEPEELADFVASRLAVEAKVKQRLLETLSVYRRLQREQDILSQEVQALAARLKASQRHKLASLSAVN